jgi:hypothetical protein
MTEGSGAGGVGLHGEREDQAGEGAGRLGATVGEDRRGKLVGHRQAGPFPTTTIPSVLQRRLVDRGARGCHPRPGHEPTGGREVQDEVLGEGLHACRCTGGHPHGRPLPPRRARLG